VKKNNEGAKVNVQLPYEEKVRPNRTIPHSHCILQFHC